MVNFAMPLGIASQDTILNVISKYIDIEYDELELDIKTVHNSRAGATTELVANIPIKNVKKLGRNTY